MDKKDPMHILGAAINDLRTELAAVKAGKPAPKAAVVGKEPAPDPDCECWFCKALA